MLFNSGVFLKFFAAFLLLYWLVRNNLRARNLLIVVASYVFYGWWDYRFLGLLIFSCVLDYFVALRIADVADDRKRKAWLALSIVSNLTILGFFKYYDFFASSMGELLTRLGVPFQPRVLGIILPVGISFYTFQAMSYTIDVYRRQLQPSRELINFLAYVAFFPQLVAGPIERATHLLPQFSRVLNITRPMLEAGVWLMLWGMFKKVVIADNLDPLVGMVYENKMFAAPSVILGTIAFALQIYCDFSGYSDIARGTARVLGFDVMMNFNIPYAASSITEFWRRWHISLSTWLRDYLYIPLGGNRKGPARTYLNLLATMVLGGLWHGAAWSFVLWGCWHGLGLAVHRAMGQKQAAGELPKLNKETGTLQVESTAARARWKPMLGWAVTMLFVLYGWLLFRAKSLEDIVAMTAALANFSAPPWLLSYIISLGALSLPVIVMEIWQWRAENHLVALNAPGWALTLLEGALLVAIGLFWGRSEVRFIYFQF